MAKENESNALAGPLVMGVGGAFLLMGLAYALSTPAELPYITGITPLVPGLMGGIGFLMIGLGLEEILLLVAARSRKRSD